MRTLSSLRRQLVVVTRRALRAAHAAGALGAAALLPAALAGGAAPAGAQQVAQADGRAARAGATAAPALAAAMPAPDPHLTPEDVVGIVLDALARNDDGATDRGLAVVFGFASPSNRAAVGSLERFADVVRDDGYRPLLYHQRAVRGAMKVDGARATQRVIVTALTGERVIYTFTLSRQGDGAYKGCWMTDGVTREPPSSLAAPRMALGGAPGGVPRAGHAG